MNTGRFTGHCARGHERIDFTDGSEFERHLKGKHGKHPLKPGGASHAAKTTRNRPAPGWSNGKPAKAYAWKAPHPSRTTKVLDQWVASGQLMVSDE